MAINQINTADFDYAMMLSVINLSYKTQHDITITNYAADTAPQVTAGSIFANNGAIFENTTLATPTGYAGLTNSTTFYLYYDEDPGTAFIFSNTAPTWSDAKQGWYNGNDRAFYSMYKDSGGTLYENKRIFEKQLQHPINLSTKILEIGAWNMDATASVAIPHGLTLTDIISVSGTIFSDAEDFGYSFSGGNASSPDTGTQISLLSDATNVTVYRFGGGFFDSVQFDSTAKSRGNLYIRYKE